METCENWRAMERVNKVHVGVVRGRERCPAVEFKSRRVNTSISPYILRLFVSSRRILVPRQSHCCLKPYRLGRYLRRASRTSDMALLPARKRWFRAAAPRDVSFLLSFATVKRAVGKVLGDDDTDYRSCKCEPLEWDAEIWEQEGEERRKYRIN